MHTHTHLHSQVGTWVEAGAIGRRPTTPHAQTVEYPGSICQPHSGHARRSANYCDLGDRWMCDAPQTEAGCSTEGGALGTGGTHRMHPCFHFALIAVGRQSQSEDSHPMDYCLDQTRSAQCGSLDTVQKHARIFINH